LLLTLPPHCALGHVHDFALRDEAVRHAFFDPGVELGAEEKETQAKDQRNEGNWQTQNRRQAHPNVSLLHCY
jgi:hypothetical protein